MGGILWMKKSRKMLDHQQLVIPRNPGLEVIDRNRLVGDLKGGLWRAGLHELSGMFNMERFFGS